MIHKLNNIPDIYYFDLDTEKMDKPWLEPGAKLDEYFNYGHTEETFKIY